jgi:HPt (histidine-containing phosphotransfer) domain-containing protein
MRPDVGTDIYWTMVDSAPEAIRSTLRDVPDMVELIQEFVINLQDRVTSLEQFIQQRDLASLTRLAHQLKGASGGYGFDALGQAAARVEHSIRTQSDLSDIETRVDELVALCRRASAG